MTSNAQFAQMLKDKGLRATNNRLEIMALIGKANAPLEAKEIYAQLSKQHKNIGVATVYRSLGTLEKAGILQRQLNVAGHASNHYQLPTTAKGQIICSHCGKVEEIDLLPELKKLQQSIQKHSRFAKDKAQSVYIVAECRNKENPDLCD